VRPDSIIIEPSGMDKLPDPVTSSMRLVCCTEQVEWLVGAPVALVASALFAPAPEDGVGIVLEFQNLSEKIIDQLYFSLLCSDSRARELRQNSGFSYPSLDASPGETFGLRYMIRLPEHDIRKWVVTVDSVIYADGSVWENPSAQPLTALARQYSPASLGKGEQAYRQAVPERSQRFLVEAYDTWWRCGCGQINRNLARPCIRCDASLRELLEAAGM